jgi:hypothetical protein
MKKFLQHLSIFFLPLCALYFITGVIIEPDRDAGENDYMASILDKHKRLDSITTQKILFGGGSNLAFSLNSDAIEKEFGIPVVNLGLHGGLGLEFILGELRSSIKEGDIVFLSIEYLLDVKGDEALKKHTALFFPESKHYYSTSLPYKIKSHMENTRMNLKALFGKSDTNSIEASDNASEVNVYSREAFNVYGDAIAHLIRKSEYTFKPGNPIHYSYWKGIGEINKFSRYAWKKGVEVFFIFPNFPLSEYNYNQKTMERITADVVNDLDVPVLNRPSDVLFPDSLIYDTKYHLIQSGRELRTNELIEAIKSNEKAGAAIKKCRQSLVTPGS